LIIGFTLTIYITYSKIPVYQSKATIVVNENPNSSFIMDFTGTRSQNNILNEIQKIKSRSVAKEVIKDLWSSKRRNNLFLFGTRKSYLKGHNYKKKIKSIVSFGLWKTEEKKPIQYYENYSETIGEKFCGKIIKNTQVSFRKNTNLIEILYNSYNPHESTIIVNKIANVYKELEKKWSNDDAINTVQLLEKLVIEQEQKLYNSEEIIKEYKLQNTIYDPSGNVASISDKLNEIINSLHNFNAELNINIEKKKNISLHLTKSEKDLAKQLFNDINKQVEILRLEISSLESEIIKYVTQYGKEHDLVKELNEKLITLKENLNSNVQKLIDKGYLSIDPLKDRQEKITELLILESEIIGQKLKINEFNKLKTIYDKKLTKLPDKQLEFSRLLRDVEIYNLNYTFIRQKLEEARISLASTSGKVQILDLARINRDPISPNHQRDLLLGFLLSTLFAIGFVITIEILDNTIKSPIDIDKHKLTILGLIPSIEENKKNIGKNFEKLRSPNKIHRRLITKENPRSPISEAYRSLRTNVMFTNIDNNIKSILVSSAGPGEWKTTTVANMAITYANLGKKTLLIDTDLRRPVVHKVLNLDKEPGITNYLSGDLDNFKSIIKETEIKNLFAVTSGIIPPNPSELLGSNKMNVLIDNLEKDWDIILFDSPPLVAVTDATMVSKAIDKIIIVVKVGHTDKKAFEHTIQSLKNVNAPIGGIVLNAITQNNSYGNYYYYYQYYNYYGEKK
jgi:tyrosine-protein kinase Etk/Wzc